MNKEFNGKIIRHPKGKAGEYSYIAADAWFGCSNGCTYCYLKTGFWKRLFTNPPHLKSGIRDNEHAFELFKNDVEKIGITTLQKYGIFLNFESDPFLPETGWLTQNIVNFCAENKITVKLLTKRASVFYDPGRDQPRNDNWIWRSRIHLVKRYFRPDSKQRRQS